MWPIFPASIRLPSAASVSSIATQVRSFCGSNALAPKIGALRLGQCSSYRSIWSVCSVRPPWSPAQGRRPYGFFEPLPDQELDRVLRFRLRRNWIPPESREYTLAVTVTWSSRFAVSLRRLPIMAMSRPFFVHRTSNINNKVSP